MPVTKRFVLVDRYKGFKMDKNKEHNHLACDFSLNEQLYAQITFHGCWICGFLGIALQNWKWAILYFLIVAVGILGACRRKTSPTHRFHISLPDFPRWT